MADPRTTFFVPDDRQVIVYFEWEAPVGTHHCEGTLRGPNGQLAVMSSFDYPAKQPRFGGFWTIPLSENATAGMWTFESRVDGESGGNLTFEIVAAKRPDDVAKKELPPPTPAEIYARGTAAGALIEKLDGQGHVFDPHSGFFLDSGVLVTAFRAIDGAQSLRVRLPDGSQASIDSVLAWNRRQDWALLNVPGKKTSTLKRADAKSVIIGDHCYWFVTQPGGSRVIADAQIVGKETHDGWGDRFSISSAFDSISAGGPVLNDHGDVLGLLGGALPDPRTFAPGATFTLTGSVVPIDLISAELPAATTQLQTLWAAGQFTRPVTADRDVSFGMITRGKPPKGKLPFPKEMNTELSARDEFATIVVAFQAIQPWKDTAQLEIYDVDNHRVSHSDAIKMNVRSGETQERFWTFPLTLKPGLYRADVSVGQEVAWRQYFRVNE